jgi:hypothetical protein
VFDRVSPDATLPARVVDYSPFCGPDGPRTATSAGRQDFDAIAMLIAGCSDLSRMSPGHVTTDTMRTAFAQYAKTHKAAPIQRCWSTWNVLCCAQSTPVSPRGPAGQGNGAPSVPALPDRILNPPLTDKVRIHPDADIEERRIRVKARHPRGCPGTDEANQPSSSPARQRRSNHPVRASAQEPRRGGLYGGKKWCHRPDAVLRHHARGEEHSR